VYSYDEDDMVLDPSLAEHLSHFGIDMLKMQKVREDLAPINFRFSFLPLWPFCA
jgi:ubiquitin carboxyl-terminal hydrolase 5/13